MPGESSSSLSGPKWAVLGAWVLGALSLLGPRGSALVALGTTVFWVLVAAHAIECVAFLPRLRRAPGSLASQLVRTFLFGILHVRDLPASRGAGGGAAGA